ncbi:hypothetical protein MC885_016483, partial [Smutsia gigantea]
MSDAALFEFLHTEMVAELWAHDPKPGPGNASSTDGLCGLPVWLHQEHSDSMRDAGTEDELVCPGGHGFHVGQAPGERLPQEMLAFREELDVLKFLCKDLRVAIFQKQMDSLCTHHQGTYTLQHNSFPSFTQMASGPQYLEDAAKSGASTCGLLSGTLSTLGVKSLPT